MSTPLIKLDSFTDGEVYHIPGIALVSNETAPKLDASLSLQVVDASLKSTCMWKESPPSSFEVVSSDLRVCHKRGARDGLISNSEQMEKERDSSTSFQDEAFDVDHVRLEPLVNGEDHEVMVHRRQLIEIQCNTFRISTRAHKKTTEQTVEKLQKGARSSHITRNMFDGVEEG